MTRIARGGMGEVFRAVALNAGGDERPVVVKRILPVQTGNSDLAELFLSEARLLARLAHPNLVQILDFGVGDDGDYYLVQELIEGIDLGRLCRWRIGRGDPLPVPIALFVAAQALRGLDHVHARSAAEGPPLVHRNLSPGNVLLSTSGDVKVTDFGVALAAPLAGDSARSLCGNPSYMAPEQHGGEPLDGRADVFSLGVVLFETLTGSKPFPGTSVTERMEAALAGRLLHAGDLRGLKDIGEPLEALLARALAPRPEDRFPDAAAMAAAIEALAAQGQPIAAQRDLSELVTSALPEATMPSQRPPEIPPEENLEGCELTRDDEATAFTTRLAAPAEVSPDAIDGGPANAVSDTILRLFGFR